MTRREKAERSIARLIAKRDGLTALVRLLPSRSARAVRLNRKIEHTQIAINVLLLSRAKRRGISDRTRSLPGYPGYLDHDAVRHRHGMGLVSRLLDDAAKEGSKELVEVAEGVSDEFDVDTETKRQEVYWLHVADDEERRNALQEHERKHRAGRRAGGWSRPAWAPYKRHAIRKNSHTKPCRCWLCAHAHLFDRRTGRVKQSA